MDTKQIRKELKEKTGYNSRQVTVRSHYSELIFTIRDINVDANKVKSFAEQYENIDYDYATGEILCGGNIFVRVMYSEDVENALIEKYIDDVTKAIAYTKDNTDYNLSDFSSPELDRYCLEDCGSYGYAIFKRPADYKKSKGYTLERVAENLNARTAALKLAIIARN